MSWKRHWAQQCVGCPVLRCCLSGISSGACAPPSADEENHMRQMEAQTQRGTEPWMLGVHNNASKTGYFDAELELWLLQLEKVLRLFGLTACVSHFWLNFTSLCEHTTGEAFIHSFQSIRNVINPPLPAKASKYFGIMSNHRKGRLLWRASWDPMIPLKHNVTAVRKHYLFQWAETSEQTPAKRLMGLFLDRLD